MKHIEKIAREAAFTEALQIIADTVGKENDPEPQTIRIIAAIKHARDTEIATVKGTSRIDYLERLQRQARTAWHTKHEAGTIGEEHDAVATVETPLGTLSVTVWRTRWTGARGEREAWRGEYYLAGSPITVAEIRAAGLARRPTQRFRVKKDAKITT